MDRVRFYSGGTAPFTFEQVISTFLAYKNFLIFQLKNAYSHSLGYACAYFAFGVPMYYNMSSVIYEENPEPQQRELLNRMRMLFEDALEEYPL